jgi:3',5'-cyclic AMP phosphodiesterase CpdA
LPCPQRFRLAAVGDIQTNPYQFERIVERLHTEAREGEALGEPLLGLLLLGDLTESSRAEEFELVRQILDRMPVPTAATPGNHDIYRRNIAFYNRTFGPGTHAFSICSARVVLLDTGSGTLAPSVEGRLGELLARRGERFLLAGMHYPPYPGLTGQGWAREDQAHHLLVELAIAEADLVLTGHVHALREFTDIPVGDRHLREVIVGTAGANQGLGVARYGYLRVVIGAAAETCFVEVPPPGWTAPPNDSVSESLPNCGVQAQ